MTFFTFEADFVDSLRCIPMQVRYKLDTCGIKLKLSDWHELTQAEREALVELPCTTQTEIEAYQQYLQQLILERTGTPASQLPIEAYPLWMDSSVIPANLQEKAQEFGVQLTLEDWMNLSPLQRFVLIKLSRPGHENKNFPRAIAEFNLV
ncbi:nitrate reductase associated protein [Nostoc sp. FACHB-110]|uniref:nitrate reductase associated protein n=1 Tax=Nostoc sp. FACHB-110 TaxID=2692834 RepID=UPI001687D0D8|nr:nitrate reductase associated protein [Nostoc sp. FACHB-110]MBD2437071.1 nitrate reductase associated protein [Nostoc sp. FACHB-110]